jgi:hypothetical protein
MRRWADGRAGEWDAGKGKKYIEVDIYMNRQIVAAVLSATVNNALNYSETFRVSIQMKGGGRGQARGSGGGGGL